MIHIKCQASFFSEKKKKKNQLEIVFVKHYAPNHMLASKDNTR